MCLLIFAHQASTHYPLVVAANRDEFHARPTAGSQFWDEYPGLLAGRDLEQGGTWMGFTRQGRFAAITNYRDPSRTTPAPRSRGELPLQYLVGDQAPEPFLGQLAASATDFAGFNLLLGDSGQLWYFTNSPGGTPYTPLRLEPGIYGLSNARLDTAWPKVSQGKARLQQLLESNARPSHETLFPVVGDRELADHAALHSLGLDNGMDLLLSSQFIVTERYGTRSTTTLWTDRDGQANWRELSFDAKGDVQACSEMRFELLA